MTYETLVGASYDYHILAAAKAIGVRPEFPHATQACAKEVVIPIVELLPFLPVDSFLKRI
jgi:hypothetical protein